MTDSISLALRQLGMAVCLKNRTLTMDEQTEYNELTTNDDVHAHTDVTATILDAFPCKMACIQRAICSATQLLKIAH